MVREGNLLAVFNSTHRVMKAEYLLKELHLPMLLIPAPRQLQTDCGLAIRFEEQHREAIMEALESAAALPEFIAQLQAGTYVTIWSLNDRKDEQ